VTSLLGGGEKGPRTMFHFGDLAMIGLVLLLIVSSGAVWGALEMAEPPGYTGGNPVDIVGGLILKEIRWTGACTAYLIAEVLFLLLLVVGIRYTNARLRGSHTRLDSAARHLADVRDLAHLGPAGSEESARRLRPSLSNAKSIHGDETGIMIGRTLVGDMAIRQSWEDMAVDIWGPRVGKTTCRAIPAIVAAPGPVVVTSVKGDVVDATREVRAQRGKIWVFDPQGIIGEEPAWWWNPLSGINTITGARRVAAHFASGSKEEGMERDAFFEIMAEELIANMLLAAAVSGRNLLDVYRWATDYSNREPADILKEYRYEMPAATVYGVLDMPDKRPVGGVYSTAQKMLFCLTEPTVTRWITPGAKPLPAFDPNEFVRGCDTLYLLSMGGAGSPAPLIAACTDAVLLAGERFSIHNAGRRLDPPLLSVLDEAANICRIRELPNLYSHYGSRGMPIITILQSYAQGEEVWGAGGMRKLWSAANVRTYGGGVIDTDFLEQLSQLVGYRDVTVRSTSLQQNYNESLMLQNRQERILPVSELGAMPRGRMLVLASGAPPALARTCPWQTSPYADLIKASLAKWDPLGSMQQFALDAREPPPQEPPQAQAATSPMVKAWVDRARRG